MNKKKRNRVRISTPNHKENSNIGYANKKGFYAENTADKISYLEGVVDKQFWMYDWCEEKVSTLATIDSILLAVLSIVLENIKNVSAADEIGKTIQTAIMFLTLIPLSVSLIISLFHIRPKMGKYSNKGRPNHRSSNGIRHFKDRLSYYDAYTDLTCEDICKDLAYQIYGMNTNIWKNQKTIKIAVALDVISLIGFLLYVIFTFFWPYVAPHL